MLFQYKIIPGDTSDISLGSLPFWFKRELRREQLNILKVGFEVYVYGSGSLDFF